MGVTTAKQRNGITVTNIVDASGAVLKTIRIGTNGTQITQASHRYDAAGRLESTTNAVGGITTFAERMTNNYAIRTTTYPNGTTREETFYRDGQLAKLAGTAVHPVRYLNGVADDGTGTSRSFSAEIKLDADGNDTLQTVTNFYDLASRNYRTVYGDASFRYSLYNVKGQRISEIDPDGVTTLYQYNDRGEAEYVATDMNRDGVIDFGAVSGKNDRIAQAVSLFSSKESKDVQQNKSFVWLALDSTNSTLTSLQESTTDGLTSWSSSFGLTTRTDSYYPTNRDGNHYVTNTAPDGTYAVTHYLHGFVQSMTTRDSAGTQLSKTTYGYDAHGRQQSVTDARNGSTSVTYDNADRRSSVTSPAPGTGEGAQTTSYTFDAAGRVTRTTHPDGTSLTNEYFSTGELKKLSGSRTYPVEYVYDTQGRMTNMITWQDHVGNGGKAITRWSYDGKRGFMTNKVYHGQSTSLSYTHTKSGRIEVRTGERGTRLTNIFNSAGDVVTNNYSDGTSTVVYHLDRSGRRTNIVDAVGSRVLAYSDSGLLLSEANISGTLTGLRLTNGYDSFLRRTTCAFFTNNGSPVFSYAYSYDAASRTTNVSDGNNAAGYSYLANPGLTDQIQYSASGTLRMTTVKKYDYLNRLREISSTNSSVSLPYSYAYNNANQRIRGGQPDGSYWLYDYDELGQVMSGKRYWGDGTPVAGQQFEYVFDDIGNRITTKAGGDENGLGLRQASYSVNSLNQYTSRDVPGAADIAGIARADASVTVNGQSTYRKGEYYRKEISLNNSSGPILASITNLASGAGISNTNTGFIFLPKTPESFSFDSDGNGTGSGRWTNRWDAENRLIEMESIPSVPIGAKKKMAFTYDERGRRCSKVVSNWNGSAWVLAYHRKFVCDGWNLIAELDENNTRVRTYMWGLDLSGREQGAGGVGGLLAINEATNGVHFAAYDGNGNICGLVSAADGSVSARYEYDPFGKPIRATGVIAASNPIRFSSKYIDLESGWTYYGHRYYDGDTGRWPNRDPIGEAGGINVYSLAGNDTLNRYDAQGLKTSELKIVLKSFILDIGAVPGQSPPDANQVFWTTFWQSTARDYRENPPDDRKRSGQYRLYSERTFSVSCCGGRVTDIWPLSPVDTAVGMEGTLTPPAMEVSGVINPTPVDRAFGWFAKGRPHDTAEILFQLVKRRQSRFIWHSIGGLINCDSSDNPYTTSVMHGSAFPSHRYWENGTQRDQIPQGPISALWVSDPNDATLVR